MNKKWFASDMAFKIYSLLIAVFLWVFVIYDQNPDSTKIVRNIPITYSNLDSLERSGYTVLKEDDLYADFKIKGKRVSLGNLSKNNIRASVTFSDFYEGEHNLSVDVKLPQNDMSVSRRNPEIISVKVEKLITKELPVGIIYEGTNENGKLACAELKTDSVTVIGPESVMNKVEKAKVTLDYAEIASSESGTADIHIFDSDGGDMTYDKNIRLSVDRMIWNQKIYNVKDASIEIVFGDGNIYTTEEIKILETAIKFSSSNSKNLDHFDKIRTRPLTAQDIKKLKNGETIDVVLDLPEKIELLKQDENGIWAIDEEASVNICATLANVEEIILKPGKNLRITNQEANKDYSLLHAPEYISLKHTGESSKALQDITFEINAKALGPGEHEVEITAVLPETVTMAKKYTAKLMVKNK